MKQNIEQLLDSADLYVATNNYSKAISIYNQIINLDSNCDEAYLLRGEIFVQLGEWDKGLHDVLKAISIDPEYEDAYILLSNMYASIQNIDKAIKAAKQAVQLNGKNADAENNLIKLYETFADTQLAEHQPISAIKNYQHAMEVVPAKEQLLYKHAFAVSRTGRFEQAQKLTEAILLLDKNHVPAKSLLVSIYEKTGQLEKGWALINALIEEYPDNVSLAITYGKFALRNGRQIVAIDTLLTLCSRTKPDSDDELSVFMLLGKLYDAIAEYDEAFKCFDKANSLKYNDYSVAEFEQQVTSLISYFSKDKFNKLPSSENNMSVPVYILGMPRSGTSLIEQIVSSHSSVYGGGELHYVIDIINSMGANENGFGFPQLLDKLEQAQLYQVADDLIALMQSLSPESKKITDKLPHNFLFIGLLHKLLPKAKIINCLRYPVDNCLSCYFQHFGGYHPYAYNLSDLGRYYQQYKRLMNHWENELNIPVLNVQYENMVKDTKIEVGRILDYLELDWEDNCLAFL